MRYSNLKSVLLISAFGERNARFEERSRCLIFSLRLHISIQAPILNRFADMFRISAFANNPFRP